ncbi:MAG: ATPase [Methylobacteriaceae bacterium]|nr:ATPase [Methylobacteriaceae bacterium]
MTGIFKDPPPTSIERNPIQAVRQAMLRPLPQRFYSEVGTAARGAAFVVTLDGKTARTPRRAPLALPTRVAAQALAAEWEAQGAAIDPATMPLTRLANSAIDGVACDIAAVQADIVKYAASDLLCYRAAEPRKLVAAQAAAWDGVLRWAREALAARFILSEGVIFVEQPASAIEAMRTSVASFGEPVRLACLHVMTTLTGSALLALAVARGHLSAEAAWTAAHVDEDFQMQRWGADREALERRSQRWQEMDAAARLLALLR